MKGLASTSFNVALAFSVNLLVALAKTAAALITASASMGEARKQDRQVLDQVLNSSDATTRAVFAEDGAVLTLATTDEPSLTF